MDPRLPPPEQLSGYLVQFRRWGLDFDTAWELTLQEWIAWPESKRETADWRAALAGVRESWRAAYERWPQEPSEVAAAELGRILSEERRVA